jgi:hypothetical protein
MIAELEVPGLTRIGTVESRRLVEIPVPGLPGSYHQDLGHDPLRLRLEGSLHGHDAQDAFLAEVRRMHLSAEPVDFVADITTATALEQMLVADLRMEEVSTEDEVLRYAITLVQYTEPPPEPALDEIADEIADEADALVDIMDVPDLLSAPDFGDPTPPLQDTLDEFDNAMDELDDLGPALNELFGI